MDKFSNELFVKCYSTLVKQLPMNDTLFTSELYSRELLPGNLKDEIKAEATKADKAAHFLDNAIKNSTSNFKKLIAFLLEYQDNAVQKTAEDINKMMEATDSMDGPRSSQHAQQPSTHLSSGAKRSYSDLDNGRDVSCLCGSATKLFQAKKPTDKRNTGRWFYKCAKEKCRFRGNFFQWADERTPTIWCNCKKPAGRVQYSYGLFYTCGKKFSMKKYRSKKKCRFFHRIPKSHI